MKKKYLMWLIMIFFFGSFHEICTGMTLSKVGQWGSGNYESVIAYGNYAFCIEGSSGLDIIDIQDPTNPIKVSNFYFNKKVFRLAVKDNYVYVTSVEGLYVINIANPASPFLAESWKSDQKVGDVFIKNQYSYIANEENGLTILNISDPTTISQVGNYNTSGRANSVFVEGNYAYLICSKVVFDSGSLEEHCSLFIIDISSPTEPLLISHYDELTNARDIFIKNNYAYISDYELGLRVVDISDTANPVLTGSYITNEIYEISVTGNYAFISNANYGLLIINISNPSAPTLAQLYDTDGSVRGITLSGDIAYVGDRDGGLLILDITTPSKPSFLGRYNNTFFHIEKVLSKDNSLYLACGADGVIFLDISNPNQPELMGRYNTSGYAFSLDAKNDLIYVADSNQGIKIIDFSNPEVPIRRGICHTPKPCRAIKIVGNYALVTGDSLIGIVDISNPDFPILTDYAELDRYQGENFVIKDDYLYTADSLHGMRIFKLENPAPPTLESSFEITDGMDEISVYNNYAYLANNSKKELWIVDISNPTQPTLVTQYQEKPGWTGDMVTNGQYLYTMNYPHQLQGLRVFDISTPTSPIPVAAYSTPHDSYTEGAVAINNDYIYLGTENRLFVLKKDSSSSSPRIKVNHTQLHFYAEEGGLTTSPQTLRISNSGSGTLNWTLYTPSRWLKFSPESGINNGEIAVEVDASDYYGGNTVRAILYISSPGAANSPVEVEVFLHVYNNGQTSYPFGQFATPTHGSTVSSSIPVTGWALDDIGVESVQIFRESNQGLVYIGDAVFVEGARPDVEQTYPNYPMNYKAGWGYMMLTNFLPGGNGIFNIHAIATDKEGNQVTLGTKTITVDNANTEQPFGALDTPFQGGPASGKEFINFGWVLTPLPNTIPTDGTSIKVWIDGVNLGSPVYNKYREDIAGLFPDYNNSNGAGGNFIIDTTPYTNGVHTIQWTATDDDGNSDGIGSRYFNIINQTNSASTAEATYSTKKQKIQSINLPALQKIKWNNQAKLRKGFSEEIQPTPVYANENNTISYEIKELDRVEIQLSENQTGTWLGYQKVGNSIRPLPIGSTLDQEKGTFSWYAAPGFVGKYVLIFLECNKRGKILSGTQVLVNIKPKY